MDEYRFQPRSNGATAIRTGRWVLKPDQEWRLPKFYYMSCHFQGGCSDGLHSQPMLRIRLSGMNDSEKPVDAQIDIVLPAEGMGRAPIKR
jgi:hypothetical protein